MRNPPRVAVLRPRERAGGLLRRLSILGFDVRACPAIALRELPEGPAERRRILDFDRYDQAVFLSPAAARIALARLDAVWPQWPEAPAWIAVGAATARVLEPVRSPVLRPEDERTEGLLALPEFARPGRVLLIAGRGGRQDLAAELEARGHRVERLEVYERVPEPDRYAGDLEGADAAVVTSVEILDVLAGWRPPPWPAVLIVPSPRVEAAARKRGYAHVMRADGASDDAVVEALQALRARSGGEV